MRIQRMALPVTLAVLAVLSFSAAPLMADHRSAVKAFVLNDLPSDHGRIEKLFASFRDAGADTIILETLSTAKGTLSYKTLPSLVFLAHQARLKIFVVLATRGDGELVRTHPQWEDRRYDLQSGTLVPSGRMDLFRADVLEYLVKTIKDISSYSVDGILLGEDYLYGDVEGLSREVFTAYQKKYAKELVPGKLFVKMKKEGSTYHVVEYGEEYVNLAKMRYERLAEILKAARAASRGVNRDVRFGVPLRLSGYEDILSSLPEYATLVHAFKNADPDHYWVTLPHRETEGLNYKKGMEAVSRASKIIATAVEDGNKALLIISMMNQNGRLLPYTEIEEATEMARNGGVPTIAYRVKKDLALPVPITRKLFNPH